MPQDAAEVRVGANGQVYVAPEGTPQPAAYSTTLNAAFGTQLGYTSEDGVSLNNGRTTTDIGAWQSFYAVRTMVTALEFTIGFALLQWRGTNLSLAFGGAVVTGSPGAYRLAPPAASALDVRVLVCDWQDGGYSYRFVAQRTMLNDNTTINLRRTEAAAIPISLKVLAPTSGDPWYLLTNDPAFGS